MGMFDSVMVPCPTCGEEYEAQTKSGECTLAIYKLNEAPPDVLGDVNRHAPFTCDECSAIFEVDLKVTATPMLLGRKPVEA